MWARSKVKKAGGVRSGKYRRELFVQEAGFADIVTVKLAITEKLVKQPQCCHIACSLCRTIICWGYWPCRRRSCHLYVSDELYDSQTASFLQ